MTWKHQHPVAVKAKLATKMALNGLTYFFENLDQGISADWFIGIHDALTTGIMTEELPEGIPTGFRDASSGCEAMTLVSGETITKECKGTDRKKVLAMIFMIHNLTQLMTL